MQRRNDGRYNRNDYNRQNKTCLDWINGICTRTNCKFFHPETHPYYIYASKTNDIHPDELRIGCMYNNLQEQADAIWVDNYIQLITEYKNSSNFTIPSYRSFCIPFDSNKVYGEIKQFQSDIRGNYKRDNRSNRNDFSRNNYSSHGYQGDQNYQRNQNGQSSQNSQLVREITIIIHQILVTTTETITGTIQVIFQLIRDRQIIQEPMILLNMRNIECHMNNQSI
ncbi:hypothetical protein ECANGB1_1908 [Enterospora canceri]|uniref:C3H1-type domain-containing protein n=1 Tax=Enterospora canceri TaxID=1081671 RepID=A0A1Y1S8W7_9MICR|nr:hypothetical protein ECANGB1_1908 [Enterospora canceri]